MMFTPELLQQAEALLAAARARGLKIATAESCTGGLISALLTEIAGSSDVFERGFVTYSNQAKMDLLGVPKAFLDQHGAVSAQVAQAMVTGALEKSKANIAIAVTGIAGPGGGSATKPVGLVHLALCNRPSNDFPIALCAVVSLECNFGDIGRTAVRLETIRTAMQLLEGSLQNS